jgi:L-ascorbate metabolism protein UlaG (beta-lactamase superfamily)
MKFTYYGHSSFLIEFGSKKILFDPFITGNELAKDIDINTIDADYILVSHGHGDHVGDLVAIAKRTGALVIGAFEVVGWAQNLGVANVHPMNFGTYNFGFGKLKFLPAWHSSTLPDGSAGGSAGGFLLITDEGNFYYTGDTCLMTDMKLIPRYAKLDFAIMPLGGNFTMDAEDAVIAAEFIECNKIIGVHFDTFGYIKINHDDVRQRFEAAGRQLILPAIGQTINL